MTIEITKKKFKAYRNWLMIEESQWDYLDNKQSDSLNLDTASIIASILTLTDTIREKNNGR